MLWRLLLLRSRAGELWREAEGAAEEAGEALRESVAIGSARMSANECVSERERESEDVRERDRERESKRAREQERAR